jgi:hypothetical protein
VWQRPGPLGVLGVVGVPLLVAAGTVVGVEGLLEPAGEPAVVAPADAEV